MKNQGVELQRMTNFIINTIPNQGTETIRTEEALWATLSVLNEI
jgi:predicted SPOUT superfamily RNA methylase MTH1